MSPSTPPRKRSRLRLWLLLSLVALVLVVILQNTGPIESHFLFWKIQMPQIVLTLLCFLAGLGVGLLLKRKST